MILSSEFRSILFSLLIISLPIGLLAQAGEDPASITIDRSGKVHPYSHLRINNDPDNFQFAIVTDRTGGHRPGVFEDAIRKLNLLQPEFVVSIGVCFFSA